MKIDFTKVLVNLENEPLMDERGVSTLGKVVSSALLFEAPPAASNEPRMDGKDKERRYILAVMVADSERNKKPLDLVSEDISLIKKCIAVPYAPLISGQAWQMIEKENGQES
jgi:hypothetical protein